MRIHKAGTDKLKKDKFVLDQLNMKHTGIRTSVNIDQLIKTSLDQLKIRPRR